MVSSSPLRLGKKRLLIRPHEVPDRSNACDRNELGKWIDTKLGFQFGHDERQVGRAEAKRCPQQAGGPETNTPHTPPHPPPAGPARSRPPAARSGSARNVRAAA